MPYRIKISSQKYNETLQLIVCKKRNISKNKNRRTHTVFVRLAFFCIQWQPINHTGNVSMCGFIVPFFLENMRKTDVCCVCIALTMCGNFHFVVILTMKYISCVCVFVHFRQVFIVVFVRDDQKKNSSKRI